jgi:hypothetical protein
MIRLQRLHARRSRASSDDGASKLQPASTSKRRRRRIPVYADPMEFVGAPTPSSYLEPAALDALHATRAQKDTAVLCTTATTRRSSGASGRSRADNPLQTGNMSVGINLKIYLIKKSCAFRRGYDVEIVESHTAQVRRAERDGPHARGRRARGPSLDATTLREAERPEPALKH